ncbi:MAG TPA: cytochrome c oxidase assembly protein [Methylovorus sp.]|jgi:cytochrome c oxidase assembly protein subunit 11|nr:cytochrome c oxidase assembly protein [Methylovorus sp.]
MEKVRSIASLGQLNRQLGYKLLVIVAMALAFAYGLVPLYDVLCRVTGLNGKTENVAVSAQSRVDTARWVEVSFTSSVMPGLAWSFHPVQSSIRVHPGKIETVTFIARNMANETVAGQAVPSVSPGKASEYFKKIECFCFQRQDLRAGESREMPLRFYVSPDIPEDVKALTLSYAFYSAIK